ncbi:MAG: tRNA (adenosine(37)-N6)-dimethylallyltransferase MiaA [Bacteroidota bacterium]
MKKNQFLLVILGPTAVGKTTLSIRIAQKFQTEIISADSRQFYREMNIGTAKPNANELAQVPHHFINSHSIHEDYNVGQYEKDVMHLLEQKFKEKPLLLLTGGSGLYIRVVTEGMDEMPETHSEIRAALMKTYQDSGLSPLLEELAQKDPMYYDQVDRANPHRIIRALEVCRSTGKTYSSFRKQKQKERPFHIIKIGLYRERELLYQRIEQRMDLMLEQGLEAEARALYPFRSHLALQTVGYQEFFPYFENQYDWDECVRLLKRNSRRYAKRQLTWFRRDPEIHWFEAHQEEQILRTIQEKIGED